MSKYIAAFLFITLGLFSAAKANHNFAITTGGDTMIVLSNQGLAHQTALTVAPKRTQDFVKVNYVFLQKEAVEMNVENGTGEVFLAEILEANEKGTATIQLDVRDFPAGTYYVVIKTASGETKMEFLKD